MSPRPTPESLFGISRDDMRELWDLQKKMEMAYGGPLSPSEQIFCALAFIAQLRKRVDVLERLMREDGRLM